jgi:hypothetical protein
MGRVQLKTSADFQPGEQVGQSRFYENTPSYALRFFNPVGWRIGGVLSILRSPSSNSTPLTPSAGRDVAEQSAIGAGQNETC